MERKKNYKQYSYILLVSRTGGYGKSIKVHNLLDFYSDIHY